MHRLLCNLSLIAGLIAGLFGAPVAHAAEVRTTFGSFSAPDSAPDSVTAVDREEKSDKTGRPAGMAVYSRTDDPKAVFIIVWSYAEPDPAQPPPRRRRSDRPSRWPAHAATASPGAPAAVLNG